MSRIAQVNDIVTISYPGLSSTSYVIDDIQPNTIILRDPDRSNATEYLVKKDGKWIPFSDNGYVVDISQPIMFTNNRDVDINILAKLDDKVLRSICKLNSYTASLCNDNKLWALKINETFPGIPIPSQFRTLPRKLYIELATYIQRYYSISPQEGLFRYAIDFSYYDILAWLIESRKKYPNQELLNITAKNRQLNALIFLSRYNLYPDQDGANMAASSDQLDVVQWLAENRNIYPDQRTINNLAINNKVRIITWLAQNSKFPDQRGIDSAAVKGKLDVLKELAKYNLYPGQQGINWAIPDNHLDVLKWAAHYNIFPDQQGIDTNIGKANLETAIWVIQTTNVYPSHTGVRTIIVQGNLSLLKWLDQHNIHPDNNGPNLAASSGHVDIIKWMKTRFNIYPNSIGANRAANKGHIDVLDELFDNNVVPTQDGANSAVLGGVETLQWLADTLNLYPNQEGINLAIMYNKGEVLQWLAKNGIYPN